MRDEEGLDYPELAHARQDARQSLVGLVAEALSNEVTHCAISVRDSSGSVVARFFADLGEDTGLA